MPDELRQCNTCFRELPYSMFCRAKDNPDGWARWCNSCKKDRWSKLRWGLTFTELRALYGDKCNICGEPERVIGKNGHMHSLCVDHDHNCEWCGGKGCPKCHRGLLCRSCNYQVGVLENRPKWLKSALEYLGRDDF